MSRLFERDWQYAFRLLDVQSEEDKAKKFVASRQGMFGPVAKTQTLQQTPSGLQGAILRVDG